jgi:hypothetical protein
VGKITSEDSKYAQYEVKFVHLTDLTGLRDNENCGRYVGEFNGRASIGSVRFLLRKLTSLSNNQEGRYFPTLTLS